MTITLANFLLNRPLGRGGMGEVWHATHVPTGTELAIKIITSKRAVDPHFLQGFHREVRAVARLAHPGIIRVFDTAIITEEEARQAPELLTLDSPYLVMELAGGSLRDLSVRSLRFSQQRAILLNILEALSHAHARGVIHRDLKPENVLMVHGPDGPTLKLSDFGLAHALDERPTPEQTSRVAGTPRFMAPEQILAQWYHQGPWTDLYALGCLAFWLASGSPPYSGTTTEEILHAHLHRPLPPLETDIDLPAPFGAWIGRLLAKHHDDRYQFAADAAFDLRQLTPHSESPADATHVPPLPPLPIASSHTAAEDEASRTLLISPHPPHTFTRPATPKTPASSTHTHGPPFPQTWESPLDRIALAPDHLRGTGLGLFGLRPIPMVDRIPWRDALWRSLRQVHTQRTPRAVLLEGPSGVGKTRQASWLCQRAHERGVAHSALAPHSPIASQTQGLTALLNDLLQTHNLPHEQRLAHLRDLLSRSGPLAPDDLLDCIELAHLTNPNLHPEASRATPQQRYALIARVLKRLHPHRPLILHLDDVHYGLDSLALALFLLDLPENLAPAVLIVATARPDLIITRQAEAELLNRLKHHPATTHLPVDPLKDEDHRTLVKHLLGLHSELVDDLVERTRGNPLFAVQLVGDWVARDILAPSPEGFNLRAGARAPLPDSIDTLLRDRISLLIDSITSSSHQARHALFALEIAAALGQDIDLREWTAACRLANVAIPHNLLETLTLARLANTEDHRWRFLHGALRESLQRLASEHQRWNDHHRHCARALQNLYPDLPPEVAARVGHHLFAAHQFEDCLDPLLLAADHFRLTNDFKRAIQLFEQYRQALDHLSTPLNHPRRLHLATHLARTLAKQGRTDEAMALIDALPPCDDPTLDAQRLFAAGVIARSRGDILHGLSLATACLERLRPLIHAASSPDPALTHDYAKALQLFADLHYSRANLDTAASAYRDSLSWTRKANAPSDMASAWLGLGAISLARENPEQAASDIEQARHLYLKAQNLYGVAHCDNALGEAHRLLKNAPRALHFYQRALEALQRLGVSQTGAIRFNIGLCLASQNDLPGAQPHFEDALRAMLAANSTGYQGVAHTALAACAAHTPDWNAFDHHLQQASQTLESSGMVNLDTATLAEIALDQCLLHRQTTRARQAGNIALDQLQRLNLLERLDALRLKIPPSP
ncbi:hypothetical protein DL240_07285 [Lujinxingia litoralis]|uniref:Protein kinase domain-containing protein n=1 Tax=Lujinxingia litoralis TaxID=2211119 RepID=A0A328C811_9DELT|nr:protein kinase [Lujinxingia litoralis]RAL23943.1 hypothetical protein DL240_07285 [Lujinxingia litoralis]